MRPTEDSMHRTITRSHNSCQTPIPPFHEAVNPSPPPPRGADCGVNKVELAMASLLYPLHAEYFYGQNTTAREYDGIRGMNMFLFCFERHENPVDTGHKRYLVLI
jgi:hypothetical protein